MVINEQILCHDYILIKDLTLQVSCTAIRHLLDNVNKPIDRGMSTKCIVADLEISLFYHTYMYMYRCFFHNSAVYTGIKKPESFSHSGFSLKVARQLPLNTPKNPNRKTHLRSVKLRRNSLVFCQCKRSLQSRRYYLGFWSRDT